MNLFDKKPSIKQKRKVFDFLMNDFFAVIEANKVDIPNFLKPKEERYENQAKRIINEAIEKGKFKELYKRAIAS